MWMLSQVCERCLKYVNVVSSMWTLSHIEWTLSHIEWTLSHIEWSLSQINEHYCSIWRTISTFVQHSKWSYTWRDIIDNIMINSGIWVDASVWSKILKEKLGYSFKKNWSARPLSFNRKLQELKKILFSVKLL